jgi:hypothetical protein
MRYLIIGVAVLILIGVAVFELPWIVTNIMPAGTVVGGPLARACEAGGGKFAPAQARCVTRDCYASHSCGIWTHPEVWRDHVKRGDDIATVVFWLGDPGQIDGDTYYWGTWGAHSRSHPIVTATFRDGRLTALGPIANAPDPRP